MNGCCLWWRNKPSSYHQILLEDDGNDDTNVVARLHLSPPNRMSSANCELRALQQQLPTRPDHDHDLDHRLFIVGGVMGKLKASCGYDASCGPHGNSTRATVWRVMPTVAMIPCAFLFRWIEGDSISQVAARLCFFAAISLIFVASFASERVHRTSELYQTSLRDFQTKMQCIVDSFSDVLRDQGYFLALVETGAADGSLEVVIERVGPIKSLSLPPVSSPVQERYNPISVVDASLISDGRHADNVPIDIWLFGALMLRLRLARSQHTQTPDRCKMLWVLLPLIFGCLLIMNLAYILYRFPYYYIGIVIVVVDFLLCQLLGIYFEHVVDAEAVHGAWKTVVEEISVLAEERHGQRMVYTVEPSTANHKVTKGVIRFTSVQYGEDADNLISATIA